MVVVHADHADSRERGSHARVMATEVTDANDRETDFPGGQGAFLTGEIPSCSRG
jgi:hypothetical protein